MAATATTTQLGFSITPPSKDAFGGQPFKHAPELHLLKDRVITKFHPRFSVVENFEVDCLWRARGGTRRGEPVYGDCLKPGGLTLYYGHADFVVVFAADHLSELTMRDEDYEALMFECLCHIGSNENTGSAVLLPFDFQGFTASLSAFGAWREDLRKMANTIQPGLFVVEDEDGDEETASVEDVPPPAETLPTDRPSDAFMAEQGWPVDPPPTNGHPHTEVDAETEREFAAARSGRGRGAE